MFTRFSVIGLLKTISVFVFLLVTLTACSPRLDLHSGLVESDANDILAALVNAGIPAEKRVAKEGVSISVPSARSAEALSLLQSQGLPKGKQSGMGQVFKKDSMISSPLEERVRYLYALSQELERTLATMDGVITARVHIVLPERLVPGEPLVPSSAAVFIKHQPDVNFTPYIGKIRSLVFNSIPGLSGDAFEKVTVVAMPGMSAPEVSTPLAHWGVVQFESQYENTMIAALILLALMWPASLAGLFYFLQRKRTKTDTTAPTHAESTPAATTNAVPTKAAGAI